MKILYFAPYSPLPLDFGAPLRVEALWRAMRKVADVRMIVLGHRPEVKYRKKLALDDVLFMPSRIETRRSRYARCLLSVLRMKSIPAQRYLSSKRNKVIREIIADYSPDAVVLGDTFMSELCDLVSKQGCKVIVDTQNVESRLYLRVARSSRSIVKKIENAVLGLNCFFVERRHLRKADQLWAASGVDAEYYRNMGVKQALVAPNALDMERYRPDQFEEEAGNVVFTGGYAFPPTEAAALELIDISKTIQNSVPHFLFLVGKSPTSAMKNSAAGCDHIHITGMVDSVLPYLGRASVVAAPIVSGSGTKFKVLEAMAMKKAVLTTQLGAEGLDIENGVQAEISSADSFADRLKNLLADDPRRKKLGESARRHVEERFSLEALSKNIRRALDDMRMM